jgi:formylglycine-generating enzyme
VWTSLDTLTAQQRRAIVASNEDASVSSRDADAGVAAPDASDAMATPQFPSCASDGGAGISTCGPGQNESCCASPLVRGGTFLRSYDGLTNTAVNPATVSDFRLDRFEATVGRFRAFVAAWVAGWVPPAGSGKHTHVHDGAGLLQDDASLSEAGWDSAWDSGLASTQAGWTTNLSCNGGYQSWTASVASNETRPVVCETWFEAAAFCIWDGGFLPSEAEWNYAASAGDGQRVYLWSSPNTSVAIDCALANYQGCASGTTTRVGRLMQGDGKWGQADLAGNAAEWNLDWEQSYPNPCKDCANLKPSPRRVLRGGSFDNLTTEIRASTRNFLAPSTRTFIAGFRCARTS